MFLPPIIDRELRIAARKPGTTRLRLFAVAGMLLLWLLLMTSTRQVAAAQLGHHVFTALGVLALAGSLFSGLFLTSDCVSEEKREGTLGLLFLTDLKGYHVVLGKLVATSAQALFGMLAILPILGLPLLAGGVTGAEFARLILVLIVTLFWSLTIGLVVSTFCHHARHAMGWTLLILLGLGGVLPALWFAQKFVLDSPHMDFLLHASPGYLFLKSQQSFYSSRIGSIEFNNSLILVSTTAFLCLACSVIALPRVWHCNEASPAVGWRKRLRFWRPSARAPRNKVLFANPIFWLGTRDLRPGKLAFNLLALLGLVWLVVVIFSVTFSPKPEEPIGFCCVFLFGLHLMVKALIGIEATRRLHEDRTSGALELLLVTPLGIKSIVEGQHNALRTQYKRALQLLLVMNLLMMVIVIFGPKKLDMDYRDRAIFVELFTGGLLALYCDFSALRSAGIWAGLTSNKHYRAVLVTLGKIMLIPWACIFILIFIMRGLKGPGQAAAVFALWFVISLVVAAWARQTSEMKLKHCFREAAADRYKG